MVLQTVAIFTRDLRRSPTKSDRWKALYLDSIKRVQNSVLYNKLSATVLSAQEEEAIVPSNMKSAESGFPLSSFDVQMFTKSYLERNSIQKFRDGENPGGDWIKGAS